MPTFMRYVSDISLHKYCLEALVVAIYERGRTDIKCPETELYCHYSKSEIILKELGMDSESFNMNVVKIVGQLLLFKLLSYITLRRRLLKGWKKNHKNCESGIFESTFVRTFDSLVGKAFE